MKKSMLTSRAALASVLLLAHAATIANTVSFKFTANVDSMFIHDGTTNTNTTVMQSDFAGFSIAQGNSISGTLSYDSNALLSPYYQPPTPTTGSYLIYQSSTQEPVFSFTINNTTTLLTNGGAHMQVANNASTMSGWDTFYIESSGGYNPILFLAARLYLFDKTANALENGGVPTHLELNSFHYHVFQAGWVRQADGSQLNFSASLTSLSETTPAVPEPSALILASTSIGLLAVNRIARRRGSLQRKHDTMELQVMA